MLQKAFGFHEAQTAWAFFKISPGGGNKKRERNKEKKNETGETGLSALETLASATSAMAEGSDKEPGSLPLLHGASPGTKSPLLCVWAWGVCCPHGDGITPYAAAEAHLSWSWGNSALLGGLPHTPFPRLVSASGQTT